MSFLRVVNAELRKTVALPSALVAVAVAILGSLGITLLNSLSLRYATPGRQSLVHTSPVDVVFAALPAGTVGAVVLGVIAVSSEYRANRSEGGGRQITATLTATPRRLRVLVAKAAAVVLLVAAEALVTIPACLAAAHLVAGNATGSRDLADPVARSVGLGLYWALTALIALAVTVLTRSGIVPLIVLISNSSFVSVSLLLTRLTPLARYLPDLAGLRLFARNAIAVDNPLDSLTGGLVMAAWAVSLFWVSAAVFTWRDA